MQLRVKTLLNRTHPIPGFTYASVALDDTMGRMELWVEIAAHRQRAARCSGCGAPAPTYDHLPRREWGHVPPWGIPMRWGYAPRRVSCGRCGVRVEAMPWSEGKRPWTRAMMVFLARWARRLSWRETAEAFEVSWEAVYRSVQWIVAWGLAHRVLAGITAIGLDELHWRKGKKSENFLTLIYQVDEGCRRLLWVGLRRTERAWRRGLKPRARVRGKARARLDAVIHSKLKTARAWSLKEAFAHFWTYHHPRWAESFLEAWITRALRSRLPPMRRVAQTLRDHEPLILNWFVWKKAFSSAAVEGLNNKARVVTRRSYGFRQFPVLDVALYHTLGRLPEPELTHRLC